jgi:branched-chain amino acid transport system substrate-binding protein
MRSFRSATAIILGLLIASISSAAFAQKNYDPGASDTEIKIGNFIPYSGPASAYGNTGRVLTGYFKMVNDQGGINGRKINFISYDDGYSPPKSVEQTRKLVESDEILLLFQTLGTPTNSAVQKYLNTKKIPHLFLSTGATKWGDPKHFPWTIGWNPSYQGEAHAYAQYILKEKPDAKIAVLYQNDDFGKDYLKGLRDGLGGKASQIVAEESFETSQPTVDSNIVSLKSANADVLLTFATPKFAAQTIKKVAELGWKPLHFLTNVSSSTGAVIQPAGFENAQGIISASYTKDATDPQWKDDPGIKGYLELLNKYVPDATRGDPIAVAGYGAAQALRKILENCGDNLTRENVMKQATSLKDFKDDVLLPGILVNTGPDDYYPIEQFQLMRFEGEQWKLFGNIVSTQVRSE